MAEAAIAVALLFDDVELGGQLREALQERGARIVHEGPLSSLSKRMLDSTGAEVLVVNLDEEAEHELDRLDEVIDGDRPRVVFNDAAASRSLGGWDRARWARHLAVKVMAQGDLDPPRPHDAPTVPEVSAPPAEPVAAVAPVHAEPVLAEALAIEEATAPVAVATPPVESTDVDSESLAAELEALLAADEPAARHDDTLLDSLHAAEAPLHVEDFATLPLGGEAEVDAAAEFAKTAEPGLTWHEDELAALAAAPVAADDDFGTLKFLAEDELPPLHDGQFATFESSALQDEPAAAFGASPAAEESLAPLHESAFGLDTLTTQGPAPLEAPAATPRPAFQLDHLALAPLDDAFKPAVEATESRSSSSLLGAASSWSLVDDDDAAAPAAATPPPLPPRAQPQEFGIEKLSAADFLAPDGGEESASIIEPGMRLELVSMEEALAPKEYEGGSEMLLDDLDTAIGRLLVLGAAADSLEAVCSFLSMLPGNLRAAVLHVQHLGGKSAEALSETLTRYSELPVKVATAGARVRVGEVLVVPDGQQARVHRDGRIELQSLDNHDMRSSPIDASFTLAANVFGRNAQAIVFAGQANDALGGCQAIHDRGGQVWIESSDGQFADMVHGIEAERLHSYSGTPAELAARLVEEMSMEGRR